MGKAIGEILPYALGVAISPIPIIAIILMLVTPKAKSNGSAFAIGWVLGLAVVATIVLILAAGNNYSTSSGPTRTVSIIKLVLGVLLMVPAVRQWRGRPKPGESPTMPKWMEAIDRFTVAKSLGTGVLLSALNPKNLALSIAAGLSIAQASISTGEQVGVVIIYVALGSLTVLAPLVIDLTMQDRAAKLLADWRTWLEANSAVVTSLLLLVIAVILIGKGITGLS